MTYSTIRRIEALEAAASPEGARHIIFMTFSAPGDLERAPVGVKASRHLPAVAIHDGETLDEFRTRLERLAPPVSKHCALLFEFRYADEPEAEGRV